MCGVDKIFVDRVWVLKYWTYVSVVANSYSYVDDFLYRYSSTDLFTKLPMFMCGLQIELRKPYVTSMDVLGSYYTSRGVRLEGCLIPLVQVKVHEPSPHQQTRTDHSRQQGRGNLSHYTAVKGISFHM